MKNILIQTSSVFCFGINSKIFFFIKRGSSKENSYTQDLKKILFMSSCFYLIRFFIYIWFLFIFLGNGCKLTEGRLDIKEKSFAVRAVRHWNTYPGMLWTLHPWECSGPDLMGPCAPRSGKGSLSMAGAMELDYL